MVGAKDHIVEVNFKLGQKINMKNGFETSKGDGRGINLTTKSDWNGYSNRRQISLRDKEAHLDIHSVFLGQSPELDKTPGEKAFLQQGRLVCW